MTNYTMGRDFNGNKTVKIKIPGNRAFSIQTTGNLPKTHRSNIPDVDEINAWIRIYGSLRQKKLVGSKVRNKFIKYCNINGITPTRDGVLRQFLFNNNIGAALNAADDTIAARKVEIAALENLKKMLEKEPSI